MDEASPRPPPRRQARGQRRIAAILAAAAGLFASRGVEGTTMSAIAAQSGTSIGSLYQFFPNREALVEALAEQYLADWQRMRADLASSRPRGLRASIDAGIDARVKFHLDHAAVSRLLESNTSTARAIHELETELGSAVAFLSSYGPGIRKETLRRYARMVNAMVNGVINTIVYGALSAAQRSALIDELKSVVHAYVEERLRG
ncbi:MAG TPA: TetR/AcrR family transcriptional regulator [Candidatus Elarobacter sp.]